MRIIGNDQKNNGQNFWEILERIIGKILSIIGAGLLVVQQHRQKAVCKSRPGHLWSSTWSFSMVLECSFHVQVKSGFQLMRGYGQFSQRWSHIAVHIWLS